MSAPQKPGLVDPTTGQPLPDAVVPDAIREGRVGGAGGPVPMVKPGIAQGVVELIPADKVEDAMAAGWRPESAEESQLRELRADEGSRLEQRVIQFSNSVGFGLPKLAVGTLGSDEQKQRLRELDAAFGHEQGSQLAEVLGFATPVGAAGLAGRLAARGAGGLGTRATVGALDALASGEAASAAVGGLAERGIARALGTGATGARGLAQRVLPVAGRGATEGAIFGSIDAASEAAIGDEEITAELLFTRGVLPGALGGALVGGGLSLGGAAAGKAASKVGPALRNRFAQAGDNAFLNAAGAIQSDITKLRANKGDDFVGSLVERFKTHKLDDGARLFKETDSLATQTQKLQKATTKTGEELGALRRQLDETVKATRKTRGYRDPAGRGPELAEAIRRVDEEVLAPLRGKRATGESIKAAKRVEKFLAPIRKRVEKGEAYTFDDAHAFRESMDSLIWKKERQAAVAGVAPKAGTEELAKARRIFEDQFERDAARVMSERGTEWVNKYTASKRQFAELNELRKLSEKAGDRASGNNKMSLTDMIMAAGGLAGGLASGGAATGIAAAVAGGATRNVLRSRPAQAVAASLFDKAAKLGKIKGVHDGGRQVVQDAAVKAISKSGKKAPIKVRDVARTAVALSGAAAVKSRFDEKAQEVREALAAPESVPIALADRTAAVQPIAPSLAKRYADVHQRRMNFLASKLPDSKPVDPIRRLTDPGSGVPDSEKRRFLRYADATEDPLGVVEDFAKGKVTPEGVEALRETAPGVYQDLRRRVEDQLTELAERGERPDLQTALRIEAMFGIPSHPTQDPAFIASMQAMYGSTPDAPPQDPAEAAQPPRRLRQTTPEFGTRARTEVERIVAGGE